MFKISLIAAITLSFLFSPLFAMLHSDDVDERSVAAAPSSMALSELRTIVSSDSTSPLFHQMTINDADKFNFLSSN